MEENKAWDVIENPHMTEKAMDQVDEENKLVIMVEQNSDKKQIEDAVETLFDVTVKKVNTTITPQAKKKAFVQLADADDAMDIATRMGMM